MSHSVNNIRMAWLLHQRSCSVHIYNISCKYEACSAESFIVNMRFRPSYFAGEFHLWETLPGVRNETSGIQILLALDQKGLPCQLGHIQTFHDISAWPFLFRWHVRTIFQLSKSKQILFQSLSKERLFMLDSEKGKRSWKTARLASLWELQLSFHFCISFCLWVR